MTDQAAAMSPEEMEVIINTMKQKALLQEELLRKAGEEREELEQDLDEMCEDMERWTVG